MVYNAFVYWCMKILNLFFCLLFVISAALQYNDPDPYVWVPIYSYGAVLCWLAFRGRFYPRAYLAGMIVYTLYAGYLFFTNDGVLDWINKHDAENIAQTMKAERPWIEDTREFFGLMILNLALVINYWYHKRIKNAVDLLTNCVSSLTAVT
ncbi:transmembrane 220 family protein [Paraflavitalea speifideaquila]|uniref:transmembrane 220 family protein n=1 Tax=Paraflavitalea speifideaquila TaxID=3076558 RepID=UPI0028E6125B|nr:transmembrane 220 family protein [Paraflavitalea speifideiaquila]